MLGYYSMLALRSFRRSKVLTALMVLSIAVGIGASMTTLTVFHGLSSDPIPGKSERLFYVQTDPRPLASYRAGEEPSPQMTRYDAEILLAQKRGTRQAIMSAGAVAIEPDNGTQPPFIAEARYASADFFAMFSVPFAQGRSWSAADDGAHARVAVITQALAQELYGTASAIGRTLTIEGGSLRIIGVIDGWNPNPRFYDLTNQQYGEVEDVFIPFSTSRDLRLPASGSLSCWGGSPADDPEGDFARNAPCAWLQYWVELETPQQAADYRSYLSNYASQQRAAGRYARPPNVRLYDVRAWLDHNRVVPEDVNLQMWLALAVLGICLVNTVGLLLAKFLRRSGEIGVRRALGATGRAVFLQCLVEAGAIGLAGGLLGLLLAALGLWLVRQQPVAYAPLAHLDGQMLVSTFALSIAASLLAGLLPCWRAMRIAPAIQLKTQ
ncbi:ABC transporter permease [Xanthomonas theicola]|uniref:ABC transporter ATP-binding protein n=1 Tax=Xanthomonas theicola TaxID=56464 RepID=A0A2S6ZDY3_9XANT|nr:ABC transporter permease [Xanthomonas theicola]PPT90478.1 ABC transporter ATP-binding protein [Xanthomonas theicola]QNH23899.1 FtsX-like permease family protein [Xanthomonas theicola]